MNLLGTQLKKYFGKYLQCLKIISTSWIYLVSLDLRMDEDLSITTIFEDRQIFFYPSFSIEYSMGILFPCVSFASPLPPEV